MSKKEKLKKKVLDNKPMHFNELISVITYIGYKLDRQKGSHMTFINPLYSDIIVIQDKNGDAKDYQRKQVADIIRKYNL